MVKIDKNKRIKEVRAALSLNQTDFGKKIGLTKASISNVEKGTRNVTEQHIKLISSEFGVSENWLRTGEGKMFRESKTFTLDDKAIEYGLTDLEIAIMKNYMELDSDVRKSIVNMLKKSFEEIASTAENLDIDKEVGRYRQELEASKKARISSASDMLEGESS